MIRINKFLSDSGVCSRRKADEHILAGDVELNGKVVLELGTKIDPQKDIIYFCGKKVASTEKYVYYAFNKPRGIISTASDERGRKTVTDFVPMSPRVYPVGRLDKDSEGLILLTNDGQLTNILSHPKGEHEKEYEVVVGIKNYELRIKDLDQIRKKIEQKFLKGLQIGDKLMKADKVNVSIIHDSKFIIQMIIHTGYNRQIRRMCDKMGLDVKKLTRVRIGKLKLDNLKISLGEYREVVKEDII